MNAVEFSYYIVHVICTSNFERVKILELETSESQYQSIYNNENMKFLKNLRK